MTLAGFEPAIPARARLQTYALDRAVTGIGIYASIAPGYTFILSFVLPIQAGPNNSNSPVQTAAKKETFLNRNF
jgi:hypothetical protein